MPEWVWVLLAVVIGGAFGGGLLLGRWMAPGRERIEALEVELDAARQERAAYQARVEGHFRHTAELFNAMTNNYRSLYEHLADGAHELCDDSGARLGREPPRGYLETGVGTGPGIMGGMGPLDGGGGNRDGGGSPGREPVTGDAAASGERGPQAGDAAATSATGPDSGAEPAAGQADPASDDGGERADAATASPEAVALDERLDETERRTEAAEAREAEAHEADAPRPVAVPRDETDEGDQTEATGGDRRGGAQS